MAKCIYKSPNGQNCEHSRESGRAQCQFHMSREDTAKYSLNNFMTEIEHLLNNKDGNMQGFIFPSGFKLISKQIEFTLNLSHSDFKDVEFQQITFKEPTSMEGLNVDGDFTLHGCTFEGESKFQNSIFHQSFQSSSIFKAPAYFHQCGFLGRTNIRGNFEQFVSFNEAIFSDSVSFMGGRDISASMSGVLASATATAFGSVTTGRAGATPPLHKRIYEYIKNKVHLFQSKVRSATKKSQKIISQLAIKARSFCYQLWNKIVFHLFGIYNNTNVKTRKVFGEEVQLINVDFQRPERVNLVHVDMSMARVTGTNFFGVQFSDVNWYQPSIKREGLYEEEILNDNDISYYKFTLPQIEEAYRNIRTALERNKDYDTASDFYIGERECHRRQFHFFKRNFYCIDAWYNALSQYGTSPLRAIRMMTWLLLLYVTIRSYLGDVTVYSTPYIALGYTQHALELFSLQKITAAPPNIIWLDLAYRFIVPVMLTLTALSFRARIKRH